MSTPIKMTMIFHDDNRIYCSLSSIMGVRPRTLNDGYRSLRKRNREIKRIGRKVPACVQINHKFSGSGVRPPRASIDDFSCIFCY